MPASRSPRSFGPANFFMGAILSSVLFVATACAAAPSAETMAPEATAPPAMSTVSPTDAGNTNLTGNTQPDYASKAVGVLATLPIKGRAPKTGYSREEFGQAWSDVDHNGCDTRNDILNRDLSAKTFKSGTHDCVVLTGVLDDPYTKSRIDFVRGADTSSAIQIDHVVALNDAWQKGAQQLSVEQRTALANDPLNLLAVDGPTNQSKGAGDAATWLPPNKAFRCEYVARQISVKATYSLWVTQAEFDAMTTVLSNCQNIEAPMQQGPATDVATTPAPAAEEAPEQEPAPAAASAEAAPADVFYQNCTAVRAAGAAPISADQPGFQAKFDGDGDGVGCE